MALSSFDNLYSKSDSGTYTTTANYLYIIVIAQIGVGSQSVTCTKGSQLFKSGTIASSTGIVIFKNVEQGAVITYNKGTSEYYAGFRVIGVN